MATCKECVHNNICNIKQRYNHPKYALQHIEKYCKHFKDRSRFVELPCKVGDVIFCTAMKKIYQGIVSRIELDDEGFAIITTDGYCFDSSICYHTQEEAEQALKEKEKKENG